MYADQSNFRTHRALTGKPSCSQWTIYRTLTGPEQCLTIISSNQLIIDLHYYGGRSTPCRLEECPACNRKHLSRPYGYLLAVTNKTGDRVLFEYPELAAAQIELVEKERSSIRGLQLVTKRTAKRENAKVVFKFAGWYGGGADLPAEEPIWHACAHLFGLHVDARPKIKDAPITPPMGSPAYDDLVKASAGSDDGDWLNASRHPAAGQAELVNNPVGRKIASRNGQHNKP